VFIDLDNFKKINDRFGHHAGDRALRRVGLIILRDSRFRAFRYGGDEFVVLLPWATEAQAAEFAKRLQRRIAEVDIDGIKISVSIGIGPNEERAGAAMYAKKTRKPG
jgi:diguanylate cyclase (GGDEF)-like protein